MKRKSRSEDFVLRLFVTGSTQRSRLAVSDVKALCEKHLSPRYTLEVIDVYQEPERALDDQIVALPTLVRRLPLPLRKIIGSFCDQERLLAVLGVAPVRPKK